MGRKPEGNRSPISPSVKFRKCDLFTESVAEKSKNFPIINQKLLEFIKTKSENKLQLYGGSDKPFKSVSGLFVGLRHAHLTQDLSIVYSMHGSDPTEIRLYGVFSHAELGTGTPRNDKRQRSMDAKFKNQVFK